MAKKKIEIEVSKETHELGSAIAGIVKSIAEKKADGLSAADIATSLTENISAIMSGLDGATEIGNELAEDPKAFAKAITDPVIDAVTSFIPAKPSAPSA
jgi:hypothetical protein